MYIQGRNENSGSCRFSCIFLLGENRKYEKCPNLVTGWSKGKIKFNKYENVKLKEDFVFKADGISIVFHKGYIGIVFDFYDNWSELEFRNPTAEWLLFVIFGCDDNKLVIVYLCYQR